MVQAAITKVLKKIENEKEDYSIEFKRWFHLPSRVKKNIGMAWLVETGNLDYYKPALKMFKEMTDKEYINYLKLA